MSAEIVGPFDEYRLVVDGYSVPCAQARENDGGTVTFIMDNRLAWTVPAGAFDDVAALVATAYALGLGLPCAPSDTHMDGDGYMRQMERVPAMMRPSRVREITSVVAGEDT
jgi:hypothetical protein